MTDRPIDESARRAFEAARLGGDDRPLADFLPAPGDDAYVGTLVELILIEREFAWKAATADAPPEPLDAVLASFPALAEHPDLIEDVRDEDAAYRDRAAAQPAKNTTPARLAVGATLGRYELRGVVGRGAFAEVWRAFDPRLRREVALKICRPGTFTDDEARDRVLREAQSAARLQHPAIVRVLEVGDHDGAPFIVSDLLPGPDLAEWLEDRAPTPNEAARWIVRIARGLHYAHESGVVHRDIKPGNLLLNDVGLPVLTDFGLAHLGDADVRMTREGDVFGTPAYMSPEQARGERDLVNARSDVYSLGVVLYELLCRRRPHPETSAAALLRAVIEREPPRPRRIVRDLPRDLETIVMTAMSKEPHRRYASASRLADDLERFLERRPIEARRRGAVGRAMLWCRRNPALATTIALSIVAIAVVSVISFRRILDERDRTHDNLYRALVGEAESRIAARDTAWRTLALDRIAEAARSPSGQRDPVTLRSLAARCYGINAPSLRMTDRWEPLGDGVRTLEFAADGSWFAEGDRRGRLFIRDARTGERLHTLTENGARVEALDASADGRWLAAGTRSGDLLVWPVAALRSATAAPTPTTTSLGAAITGLSFAPTSEHLAIAQGDGQATRATLTLPDGSTTPHLAMRSLLKHDRALTGIAHAGDGKTIAIAAEGASVSVRRIDDGTEVGHWSMVDAPEGIASNGARFVFTRRVTFGITAVTPGTTPKLVTGGTMHAGFVNGVVPSGPNEFVTWSDDGSIRVWTGQANGFRPLAAATPELGAIRRLTADQNGRILIAATRTGVLSRWALTRPQVTDSWHTHHVAVFAPASSTLVADRWIRTYGTNGRATQEPWQIPAIGTIATAGGRVITGSSDGRIRLLSRKDASEPATTVHTHDTPLRRLAATADGRYIAMIDDRGQLAVVDATKATPPRRNEAIATAQDAAWSADGGTLYVATSLGLMAMDRSLNTSRTLLAAAFQEGRIARAGERLAVSGMPGGALLIDRERGDTVADLGADAVVLHATDRFVIMREPDGTLVRYRHDVSDEAAAKGLTPAAIPDSAAWRAAWALGHDRLELLAVADTRYSTRLIDARDGTIIARLVGGSQFRAAWAPDGTFIVGTLDGSVVTWSPRALRRARRRARAARAEARTAGSAQSRSILSLQADATLLSGMHNAPVWGVAISPDGRWIGTAAHDGSAKLWAFEDRERSRDLDGHFSVAWSAAFDRHSRSFFVGAGDVTRWRVDDPSAPPVRTPRARSLVGGIACHPTRDFVVWARFDGTIEAWRYDEDAAPRTLLARRSVGRAVAFSIDGRDLTVAYGDVGILRWRTDTPAFTAWLRGDRASPPEPEVLDGHVGQVQALAFSPERTMFASADSTGTIVIRHASDFRVLVTLQNDTRNIRSLSFDQHGRFLAAGAYAGRSTTWDLRRLRNHYRGLGIDW